MKKNLFLVFIFFIFACLPIGGIFAAEKVEINTASPEQLETLVGIGPVKARAIIDARPFSSVDDLIRVSGIGEKTLQKIKDQGLAFVSGQTQISNSQLPISNEIQNPNDQKTTETPPAITYPSGIVINEILPSPGGADETEEWIEFYNKNNFEVDLSNWKIEDMEGIKTTYAFDKNAKIAPNGFLVLKRPETKITLNNTTDGLNLFWPDGKIIDSLTYDNAPRNQSYIKKDSGWIWSASLTPGSANAVRAAAVRAAVAKNKQSGVENLLDSKIFDNSNGIDKELKTAEGADPWFLFFTALSITIISAIIALFIKHKFSKQT